MALDPTPKEQVAIDLLLEAEWPTPYTTVHNFVIMTDLSRRQILDSIRDSALSAVDKERIVGALKDTLL